MLQKKEIHIQKTLRRTRSVCTYFNSEKILGRFMQRLLHKDFYVHEYFSRKLTPLLCDLQVYRPAMFSFVPAVSKLPIKGTLTNREKSEGKSKVQQQHMFNEEMRFLPLVWRMSEVMAAVAAKQEVCVSLIF